MTDTTHDIPAVDPLGAALDAQESELQAEAETAFDRARRKPTGANREIYRKACAALDRFRLERNETGAADRLFTPPEALEYLEAGGWKIAKTKYYNDLKTGIIRRRDDGRIALFDLEDYTRSLNKLDGTPGAAVGGNLQQRKTLEEIERINVDRRFREAKLKAELGEWVPKSEIEIALSKRANYLRSDLKNIFRAMAGEIVKIVKGDPACIPALITWATAPTGTVDEIMDRYSRPIKGFGDENL